MDDENADDSDSESSGGTPKAKIVENEVSIAHHHISAGAYGTLTETRSAFQFRHR